MRLAVVAELTVAAAVGGVSGITLSDCLSLSIFGAARQPGISHSGSRVTNGEIFGGVTNAETFGNGETFGRKAVNGKRAFHEVVAVNPVPGEL
jgi:hypothetical protein